MTDAETISNLKSRLSVSYMQLDAMRRNSPDAADAADAILSMQTNAIQEDAASMYRDTELNKIATQLVDGAGFSYADALRSADAIHRGDFTAAAEIQRRYREQTRQTTTAQEQRGDAELRRVFGLRP